MRCRTCRKDLSEKVHHAAETGMWEFTVTCDCGRSYLWRQNCLRPVSTGRAFVSG